MELVILVGLFAIIVILMRFHIPLFGAVAVAAVVACFAYGLDLTTSLEVVIQSAISWETWSVLLMLYLITFLQRLMEEKNHLQLAHQSLSGLFNNRRITAAMAPIFIGLLPSGGAMFICGAMVDATCEDYFSKEDKTFVTTYFRHIPESFLPTYSSIILGMQLSGVALPAFIIAMIPLVAVLIILGYLFYLRKLPKDPGAVSVLQKREHVKNLVASLWALALTIILIVAADMQIYYAVGISTILYILVNRFTIKAILPKFWTAIEVRILLTTFIIMIFKDIITATGVTAIIPEYFARLPIPPAAVYALVCFACTIVSGSTATIVLCIPLAYAVIPDGGLPLLILLMSIIYAAMQFSPTHICLSLATEYFGTEMNALLKRTAPVIASFCAFVAIYYVLLLIIL